MSLIVTDAMLLAFLEEQLPPQELAEIEQLLRTDTNLQRRMATVLDRDNQGVHSIAAIWRRNRLSCPDREQLGSYLLGVVEAADRDYIKFHVEEIGCQYCQSSMNDLMAEQAPEQQSGSAKRRQRYFESSVGRRRKSND